MNSFSQLLNTLGTRRVARATGVTDAAVCKWKSLGRLPTRPGALQKRTAAYEQAIAQMAGITVTQLRTLSSSDKHHFGA